MKKERLTLEELRNAKDWEEAVIVFTKDSFREEFSEESRSYMVNSMQKYFQDGMISNSLFGNCLDGQDDGVRLDWYMPEWKVEYCYIIK